MTYIIKKKIYMITKKTHQRTYRALRTLVTFLGPISHTPQPHAVPQSLFLDRIHSYQLPPPDKRYCSRPNSTVFCSVQSQER